MEDNEFEEVTIISHTDLCSSVLPQATAERLMREIRLEVTQKISPTENVKLGSLQDPEAERRLKLIQEKLLASEVLRTCPELLQFHELPATIKPNSFLVGGKTKSFLFSSTGEISECLDQVDFFDHLHLWNEHLLMFASNRPITIVSTLTGQIVKQTKMHARIGEHKVVKSNDEKLYFRDADFRLGVIQANLEERVDEQRSFTWIQDLLIHEIKNQPVILLMIGSLVSENKRCVIKKVWESRELGKVKQMYSDHFLVSEDNIKDMKLHALHLVDMQNLRRLDAKIFQTTEPGRMKCLLQLKPTRYFRMVLCIFARDCILFSVSQSKLYLITNLNLDGIPASITSCLHFHNNVFLCLCAGKTALALVRKIPKALRVC